VLAACLVGVVLVTALFGASDAQRRRAVGVAALVGGLVLVLALVAAVRLRSLPSDLSSGQRAMKAGIDGLRSADNGNAAAQLGKAHSSFVKAGGALSSPLVAPLRFVPLVGQHVDLGQGLVRAATEMTTRAQAVVKDGDIGVLAPKNGKIDLSTVRSVGPDIEAASRSVADTRLLLRGTDDDWLLPPVRSRLDRLDVDLTRGGDQLDALALTLRVLPALLGEGQPRRAFAGFTNPSEVRGLGGILGNFVELEAANGTVHLTRTGRDSDLIREGRPVAERALKAPPGYLQTWGRYGPAVWQNVTLSPDGPSVGQVVAGLYPQSGGKPVDLVAMIDSNGLAALLELTGPLALRTWPEPVTANNAPSILGIQQYEQFPDNDKRVAFLNELNRTTFDRILTLDPTRLRLAAGCLGRAVLERHLVLWSARPEEQLVFSRLGVSGALPQPTPEAEVAGVILNNAAGNKLDWYSSHKTRVARSFDPSTGDRLAVVTTTITNGAPQSGLPAYVANSVDAGPGSHPGDQQLLVSAYGPGKVDAAQIDGRSVPVNMSKETDLDVATALVQIPAGASREVNFVFRSKSDGRIPRRLTLLHDQRPATETICP